MKEQEPLGLIFKKIYNNIDTKRNELLKDMDLTATQADILVYLFFCSKEKINQRDIENKFNIKNPTVTGILKRMEEKGFIECIIDDEDKRFKKILLTRKSIKFRDRLDSHKEEIENILTQNMSKEEVKILKTLLNKMVDNILNYQCHKKGEKNEANI